MKLTPHQRNRLVTLWMFHRKPPTRTDLLKRIAPPLAALAMLCVLTAAGTFLPDPFFARLALWMFGLIAGMAVSTFALVMSTWHVWPLVEHITDWDRVESLRRENGLDE